MLKLLTLSCSRCGNQAHAFEPWPDRPAGEGVCGFCAASILAGQVTRFKATKQYLAAHYGEEGVHWFALGHKFASSTQPGLSYWAELIERRDVPGALAWAVLAQTTGAPATEALDDRFVHFNDALPCAFKLSQGEAL